MKEGIPALLACLFRKNDVGGKAYLMIAYHEAETEGLEKKCERLSLTLIRWLAKSKICSSSEIFLTKWLSVQTLKKRKYISGK